MAQLNIDCEGPITRNDNAFELCEAFLPGGGDFFSRVSRYDDYLADIEKRAGYKAGDTLKLILPFLKAYGATNQRMEDFSRRTLVLLKGTREMLPRMVALMPTFIISTSYWPYLRALCEVTGFPESQIFCTSVDLDGYRITDSEAKTLKRLAREITGQPILSWPEHAKTPDDLSDKDKSVLNRLNEIFWDIIPSMDIGRILDDVNPVGGAEKARAVKESLKITGNPLSEVFYVGDSITDVQALELVSGAGGVPMSFNGNRYAIRAAKWACMSHNSAIISAVARLLSLHGMNGLENLMESDRMEGPELLKQMMEQGVEREFIKPLHADSVSPDTIKLVRLNRENIEDVIHESEKVRKNVRGVGVGELG